MKLQGNCRAREPETLLCNFIHLTYPINANAWRRSYPNSASLTTWTWLASWQFETWDLRRGCQSSQSTGSSPAFLSCSSPEWQKDIHDLKLKQQQDNCWKRLQHLKRCSYSFFICHKKIPIHTTYFEISRIEDTVEYTHQILRSTIYFFYYTRTAILNSNFPQTFEELQNDQNTAIYGYYSYMKRDWISYQWQNN